MKDLIINPEYRRHLVLLIAFQVIMCISLILLTSIQLDEVNKEVYKQNIAMLGKMASYFPESSESLAKIILNTPTNEQIEYGKSILSKYGYKEDMIIKNQPIVKNVLSKAYTTIFIFTILMSIPIIILMTSQYKKIYKKINLLSNTAEKVVTGEYQKIEYENCEGDFSILFSRFNQMIDKLKVSMEKLKQDKLFLKNIISDISHQLKTPLASLIVYNDLLLEQENISPNLKDEYLNNSRNQLDRMHWLIISLLKMARLEAGAISFKKQHFLLEEAVGNSIESLKPMINNKNHNIRLDVKEEISIVSDKEWLTEALSNIIKNCIEHTKENGKIEISVEMTPLFKRIVISDNGEGIDKKDIPRIFERFYKGSNQVKADSIGIGLALSKLIIEGLDGSITVKSIVDEGTTFCITFKN